VREPYTEKKESNCQTNKLKFEIELASLHCKLHTCLLVREGALHAKIKNVIVTQRNVTSRHPFQKGHDTKTNWPADHRSQYNLNLNIRVETRVEAG
jgi:hypothetical protein